MEVEMVQKSPVTVIDSIMGSGKSSWAIQYLREHQNEKFIYITPTLDECKRIQMDIQVPGRKVCTPLNYGEGKLDGLNTLLSAGVNVVCTHELFKRLNQTSIELIDHHNYMVMIDEELSVFNVITLPKNDDLKIIEESGLLQEDSNHYLHWNQQKEHYDTSYNYLKNLASTNSLIKINDKHLVWKYPTDVFMYAKKVFVLTYLFNGSIMKPYFEMEGIAYEIKSIQVIQDQYYISSYTQPNISKFSSLIHIYDGPMNKGKSPSLSANWYKTAPSKDIITIRKNLLNYYRNVVKSKSSEFLWTSYSSRYSTIVTPKTKSSFISCNMKGTNNYRDRWKLAYLINRYFHPSLHELYQQLKIPFDDDMWALSEMLQWIWRSRIRDYQSIEIFIPSLRMRNLLVNWMRNTYEYPKIVGT